MIKGHTGEERSFGTVQAQILPGAETSSFEGDQNTHTLRITRDPVSSLLLSLAAVLRFPILPLDTQRSQGNASENIYFIDNLRNLLYY